MLISFEQEVDSNHYMTRQSRHVALGFFICSSPLTA
jgi:hypothetical protein